MFCYVDGSVNMCSLSRCTTYHTLIGRLGEGEWAVLLFRVKVAFFDKAA